MLVPDLSVSQANPLRQPERVAASMRELKRSNQAALTFGPLAAADMAPVPWRRMAPCLFSRKATTIATNVPSPKRPMFLAGVEVTDLMFRAPQSDRAPRTSKNRSTRTRRSPRANLLEAGLQVRAGQRSVSRHVAGKRAQCGGARVSARCTRPPTALDSPDVPGGKRGVHEDAHVARFRARQVCAGATVACGRAGWQW
ncbi:MAG: DUF1298 domain-containing protein [Dokdonella sp.]|nr:DUF1298 domain-containing protein [Dokdonella sp.]